VFADLFRKTRALAELNDTLELRVKQRTDELESSESDRVRRGYIDAVRGLGPRSATTSSSRASLTSFRAMQLTPERAIDGGHTLETIVPQLASRSTCV
jgi:hypothetical protein